MSITRAVRRAIGPVWLTEKQIQILDCLVQGLTNAQIGQRIGNTEYVTKNYMCAIYELTGMGNRLELALWYLAKTKEPQP